ncbi:MAG TPA: peptidase S16 [Rhodospirillaceae bacterium]|nr:peptidase S16 [Rhodospirillaceae bacterium]HAA93620.1 peptidase S16 [Rhodospirillaceae bacterium]HAT35875.1 peptidase S16 [Rhodospirillaceae bacterium]|tara:strand:- start:39 stop:695 length:657 start_codon:yes stop_codon:yes gene_type:complete
MSVFDPTFEDLSESIPIFPLPGVLLLPGGFLPLNIFEPRYLNMTSDALGGGRMIGMIQPQPDGDLTGDPAVYRTGCAGRIVSFEETDDGRYLITLKGVARFDVTRELAQKDGYRLVEPDWSPYVRDLDDADDAIPDRNSFLQSLKKYFELNRMDANWNAIQEAPCDRLVTSVAMICPFEPSEKQALLEAATVPERIEVLTTLVEMAVMGISDANAGRQ